MQLQMRHHRDKSSQKSTPDRDNRCTSRGAPLTRDKLVEHAASNQRGLPANEVRYQK